MEQLVEKVSKNPFESYDLLIYIVVHSGLSIRDIVALSQTNKRFSLILYNKDIWRRLFIERFIIGHRVSKKEFDAFDIGNNKEYIRFNELIKYYPVFICFKAEVIARDRTINHLFRKDDNWLIVKTGYRKPLQHVVENPWMIQDKVKYVRCIYKNRNDFVMNTYDESMEHFIPIKQYPHIIEYYMGRDFSKLHRIKKISIYIPKEDLARIIGYLLFYGYRRARFSGVPKVWIEQCISCQTQKATLLDRKTGLRFCTEECFNKFGI